MKYFGYEIFTIYGKSECKHLSPRHAQNLCLDMNSKSMTSLHYCLHTYDEIFKAFCPVYAMGVITRFSSPVMCSCHTADFV